MFIAKFKQASQDSEVFTSDRRGNMPFIGTLISGSAKGTIINGTIFQLDGLQENKAYLCQNVYTEYEGRDVLNTEVITEVSTLELAPLMAQLGPKNLQVVKTNVDVNDVAEAAE
jgi:hypothetical protein